MDFKEKQHQSPPSVHASVSRRSRPPRSLRQRLAASLRQLVPAPTRIVTTGLPVVTMRSIPVFTRVLAQFSKFQTPSDLSDGLKTGAFDVPRRPAPDCLSTNVRSGALPFHWTTIKTMIQCCEALIVSSSPTDETVWNLTRHLPVT